MKSSEPRRLVKLLLPVELVRQLDRAVLASEGAFQDRSEFAAEAIRDRLLEEDALQVDGEGGKGPLHRVAELPTQYIGVDEAADFTLGRWRTGHVETIPARVSEQVNFGLHNRDLPSLWALDLLAAITVERRQTPSWGEYADRLRERALGLAARLRDEDLAQDAPVPAAIGFPRSGPKQAASVERFVVTSVGSARRADSPFAILGLGYFVNDGARLVPADSGLRTLGDLIDLGLSTRLPQPPAAFSRWWSHVAGVAPAERGAWSKVLRVIANQPDRDQLVAHFPEWPGQIASTNTVAFVSRSREWGLVEPKLIDGRYQLTELGSAVAREG